jgi:hypothetical protein
MLAGTGKFNVVRYKFAQTIYTMHDLVLDVLRQMGIDVPKKDGRLLQLLGSDWGRTVYGPDIWVKCALAAYDMTAKNYSATTVFLIDDCRFVNEAEAFRPLNGFLVRLDASQAVRKARCSAWRETEGHDSEISLDHYQGFNQRIDTDRPGIDAPQVAAEIMREFLSHVGKLHV